MRRWPASRTCGESAAAMARPIDKGTTFVTGGDVSRFNVGVRASF